MLIHAPIQTKTDEKVGECPSVNKYKFWGNHYNLPIYLDTAY